VIFQKLLQSAAYVKSRWITVIQNIGVVSMTSSQNIVTIHDVTMMMTFCFSKEIKFSEFAFSPFAYMKGFVDFLL
jgi:hypothetical protein